ncbi:MAG TPA: hypothetical protein VK957_21125 [Lunatimonas sp.]|nr:hypothetical protein [Lunatimonas sp.]
MLKVAVSKNFAHNLPAGQRFRMEKYDLLPDQLLYEGTLIKENFFKPDPLEFRRMLGSHEHTQIPTDMPRKSLFSKLI